MWISSVLALHNCVSLRVTSKLAPTGLNMATLALAELFDVDFIVAAPLISIWAAVGGVA